MKKLIFIMLLAVSMTLFYACSTSSKIVLWVDSTKENCVMGGQEVECFRVYKGENLDSAKWEILDVEIGGFNFEEGILKKIEIKEEVLKGKHSSGNKPLVKYTFLKEMEKIKDNKSLLNGSWTLEKIMNNSVDTSFVLPILNIDLKEKRISGYGGCNNYMASISKITQEQINLSPIGTTMMLCNDKNIEAEYLLAMEKVKTYKVTDSNLYLCDEQNKEIVSFIRN